MGRMEAVITLQRRGIGRGQDGGGGCLDLDLTYLWLASLVANSALFFPPLLLALTNNILFRASNNVLQL